MTSFSEIEYKKEAARHLLSIMSAEDSLYEFLRQAWHLIEGKLDFIDGWHIQAIAEHLEACRTREIKNLLINVPPRSSKSTLISIAFPAWVWIHDPTEKFMYASMSAPLSLEHSLLCRSLMESQWYQKRWGSVVQLAPDQNAKSFFANTAGGYRIATSVGATPTGRGANFLISDDPNSVKDAHSDANRLSTNRWFSQSWFNRLNDPRNDVRMVIQQRLHEQDVSGYIMSSDKDNEWVKLILPMEYEVARHCRTIILPKTNKLWEDPRKKEGELLCPDRIGPKQIKDYKENLRAYGYAGQYQQRPAPEEGGVFQKEWFKWWKFDEPPPIDHVIQSWDTAFTRSDDGAYSACTTWGVFKHENANNIILLSAWRARVEYPELKESALKLYNDYRNNGPNAIKRGKKMRPDIVLLEGKASGISLHQEFLRAGIPAIRFNPDKHGDKHERVRVMSPLVEVGRVWLPAKGPDYKRLRPFAEQFLDQIAMFPNAASRDLVDTMTQVLIRLRSSGIITHPTDEDWSQEPMDRKFY